MDTKLLLAGPPILLVLGALLVFAVEPARVLPRLDLAPNYQLTGQDAQPVSGTDFLGSVVLYSFVDAQCDEACAATLDLMRALEPETRKEWAAPVRLVTVVVEPVNLERLQAIAATTGASSDTWSVLGGDETASRLVRQGFRVPVAVRADGTSRVDPLLVLVDPAGVVRAVYRAPLPAPAVVQDDLRVLEKEIAGARGVKRLLYEGLHRLTCRVP
uniref:Thioredoxin domain-containing protein n=1 Tax=Thermorudis peleae TaxID=1382356 RepID=A0A831TG39_9BACT